MRCISANTRKEEITRFGAASKDTELSKVLESRSLGPEHTEAQSQLRRDIRVSDFSFQKLLAQFSLRNRLSVNDCSS